MPSLSSSQILHQTIDFMSFTPEFACYKVNVLRFWQTFFNRKPWWSAVKGDIIEEYSRLVAFDQFDNTSRPLEMIYCTDSWMT